MLKEIAELLSELNAIDEESMYQEPATTKAKINEAMATLSTLSARVETLTKALEPFASVAEWDIGEEEDDDDRFKPMTSHNYAPILTVGDLRKARSLLSEQLS